MKTLTTFILLLTLIYLPLQGAHKDFQIWNYNTLQVPVNKCIDFNIETTFRWDHNGSRYFFNYEHFEFPIKMTPWFVLGPSYRQIWSRQDGSSRWLPQYYPNFNMTFLWEGCGWKWSDRSRVAYIFFDRGVQPSAWQYRNKLAVYTPPLGGKYEMRLFVDDEIFIQEYLQGISQNRFSVGINTVILKKLKSEIAYRRQTVKTDRWYNNDVLMLNLKCIY